MNFYMAKRLLPRRWTEYEHKHSLKECYFNRSGTKCFDFGNNMDSERNSVLTMRCSIKGEKKGYHFLMINTCTTHPKNKIKFVIQLKPCWRKEKKCYEHISLEKGKKKKRQPIHYSYTYAHLISSLEYVLDFFFYH